MICIQKWYLFHVTAMLNSAQSATSEIMPKKNYEICLICSSIIIMVLFVIYSCPQFCFVSAVATCQHVNHNGIDMLLLLKMNISKTYLIPRPNL